MKLKVLGSELNALDWRRAMLKELSPHITVGMTLSIEDDDFNDAMLDYLVDAVVEVINQYNKSNNIPGRWILMGPDLYYEEGQNNE